MVKWLRLKFCFVNLNLHLDKKFTGQEPKTLPKGLDFLTTPSPLIKLDLSCVEIFEKFQRFFWCYKK